MCWEELRKKKKKKERNLLRSAKYFWFSAYLAGILREKVLK